MLKKYKTSVVAKLSLDEKPVKSVTRAFEDARDNNLIDVIPSLYRDKQPDLAYINTILVSSGANLNDDVFLPSELYKAIETVPLKSINLNHSPTNIVGVMVSADFLDSKFNQITLNTVYDKIWPNGTDKDPDESVKLHIMSRGVLFQDVYWSVVEDIVEKAKVNKMFVSMECYFDDFDFLLGDSIVKRTDATNFLIDYLRIFGGSGEFQGQPIKRVLRDILFSGQGIVENPANPESFILSVASDGSSEYKKIESASVASITINDNVYSVEKVSADEYVKHNSEHYNSQSFMIDFEKETYQYVIADHIPEDYKMAWISSSGRVVDVISNKKSGKVYSDRVARYVFCASTEVFDEYKIHIGSRFDFNVSEEKLISCVKNQKNSVYNSRKGKTQHTVEDNKMDVELIIAENKELKTKLEAALASIEEMKSSETQAKIEELSASVEAKESEITELKSKIDELEAKAGEAKEQIDSLTKEKEDIEKARDEALANLEDIKREKVLSERLAVLDKYDITDEQKAILKEEIEALDLDSSEAFDKFVKKYDSLLPLVAEDGDGDGGSDDDADGDDGDDGGDVDGDGDAGSDDDADGGDDDGDDGDDDGNADAAKAGLNKAKPDASDDDKDVANAGKGDSKASIVKDLLRR